MSPEQIRGEEVDERTDIYAIGSILYKACTGVPPFSAPSPMGVLTKHLTEDLIPPSSRAPAALPREADLVVTRAMAKERERRYRTAGELRQALVDYLARSGEDPGPAAISGSASGTIGPRRAPSVAPATAATRGDVDAYERRLMRRGRVGWILAAAMLLGGVGAGAVFLYRSRDILPSTPSVESEPNNQPAEANRLPPDTRLRASLGARIDEARGDVDLFRLEGLDGSRQVIRVDVSPLPHVDLIVSLFRAGVGTPVLSVDSGGEGEGEQIPNFPVVTDRYYVQVRERWVAGERPTESISDTYRVEWGFVDLAAGDEREVNDSLELANPIDPGGERRGFIGWKGDVDHFCLSADSSPVRAVLEPVPNVDLVLRLVHRGDVRSFKVDEGGVGQGERSEAIEDATARYTCFEVSAAGEGSNADVMYRLQLPLATDAAKGPPR
jgi:serine/threonine-protein kinase